MNSIRVENKPSGTSANEEVQTGPGNDNTPDNNGIELANAEDIRAQAQNEVGRDNFGQELRRSEINDNLGNAEGVEIKPGMPGFVPDQKPAPVQEAIGNTPELVIVNDHAVGIIPLDPNVYQRTLVTDRGAHQFHGGSDR